MQDTSPSRQFQAQSHGVDEEPQAWKFMVNWFFRQDSLPNSDLNPQNYDNLDCIYLYKQKGPWRVFHLKLETAISFQEKESVHFSEKELTTSCLEAELQVHKKAENTLNVKAVILNYYIILKRVTCWTLHEVQQLTRSIVQDIFGVQNHNICGE